MNVLAYVDHAINASEPPAVGYHRVVHLCPELYEQLEHQTQGRAIVIEGATIECDPSETYLSVCVEADLPNRPTLLKRLAGWFRGGI